MKNLSADIFCSFWKEQKGFTHSCLIENYQSYERCGPFALIVPWAVFLFKKITLCRNKKCAKLHIEHYPGRKISRSTYKIFPYYTLSVFLLILSEKNGKIKVFWYFCIFNAYHLVYFSFIYRKSSKLPPLTTNLQNIVQLKLLPHTYSF